MERKLAAILAADVVGYSRLMGENEAATLDALTACEAELIAPMVARNHGRIVKRMGDGFLVEFASAVHAVQCALDWQQASAAAASRIRFRIGINLGDIILRDGDIYGDGVNVAARLEGLAEAGGVCMSAVVHDQVRRRIDAAFRDLGDKTLKNIDDPVRVFAWSPDEAVTAPPPVGEARPEAGMLLVVPFRILGADPLAVTLSEALTESIAVALSRFDELSIVDPGAVPAATDGRSGRELGRELGVPFLLEGRVQAVGDKVRVSVQIVEVGTGQRKWSQSFDRDAGDVFALQDELTAIVASTVGEGLLDLLSKALDARPEATWSALDLTIRGTAHLHRLDPEQNRMARALFEKALAKEPLLPLAIVCECWTHAIEVSLGWPLSRPDAIDYCIERIRKLFARSERHSQAHRLLSRLLHMKSDHDSALRHSERACELNPYDSDMIMSLGLSCCYTGDGERGVGLIERACRINPYAPDYYRAYLAMGYVIAGRYAEALSVCDALPRPIANARQARTIALVMLDRLAQARQEMEAILAEHPSMTVATVGRGLSIRQGPDRDRILDALRRAGLPDDEAAAPPPEASGDAGKPSIAVLPFNNMSGDAEQDYFADGIAEDIITDLSKVSGLLVIARNSSFAYKGSSPDVRQVCRDLDVRFVLEGSVRKAGNTVRINAQLIDGGSGGHLWAERYDRQLEDIFAVQDEVTRNIVAALEVALTADERQRRQAPAKVDPEAYDCLVRARVFLYQFSAEAATRARAMLERAIAIDSGLAPAYAQLAILHLLEYINRWNDVDADHLGAAFNLVDKALAADPDEPLAYHALALAHTWSRNLEAAERAGERAIALDPNFAGAYAGLASAHTYNGHYERAIELLTKALRLDPQYDLTLQFLGRAQFLLHRYDEAEANFKRRLERAPHSDLTRAYLASLYGHTGRPDEGRRIWQQLLAIKPGFSPGYLLRVLPFRNPAWYEHFTDGLRKAGVEF